MVIKKDNKIVAKVVVFGDLNVDGRLSGTDVTYFQRFLSSEGTNRRFPEDESFYIGMDVNHNGIINLEDKNYLNDAMNSDSSDNPTILYQNVEAKKIEKIVFPEE